MKEKKTEIKSIKLLLDDKEITLTIEQAKKLKELLGEMFGKEVVREIIREDRIGYPYYPYWDWKWNHQVWYGGSGNLEYKDNTVYCSLSTEIGA